MEKAVIYARQSSGDEEQSESIEMQIQKCKELAARENLEVIGEYDDHNTSGRTYPTGGEELAKIDLKYDAWFKGQTKTKKFRHGLGDAIEKATAENAAIIIYDITRLYRPVTGTYLESYISQKLAGVKIFAVVGGQIDLNEFSSSLVASLTNRINDNQLQMQKQKSKLELQKMRDSGVWLAGTPPFGYIYDKNTRSFRVDPVEGELLKGIFKMAAEGMPLAHICQHVNARRGTGHLTNGTIKAILSRPQYIGKTTDTKGKLIDCKDGLFEAYLIDKSTWLTVQNRLADMHQPKRAKKHLYPLVGYMYCGYCGKALKVSISPQKAGTPDTVRYTCPFAAYDTTKKCHGAKIKHSIFPPQKVGEKEEVEVYDPEGFAGHGQRTLSTMPTPEPVGNGVIGITDAVLPLLASACLTTINDADKPEKIAERIANLRIELDAIAKRRNAIIGMIAKGLIGEIEAEKELTALKAHAGKLESDLAGLESTEAKAGKMALQRAFARLEKLRSGRLDYTDYRELLAKVVVKITVFKEAVEIRLTTGETLRILKNRINHLWAMPQYTLEIKQYKSGAVKAFIRYYYASVFSQTTRNDDEKELLDNEILNVITVGKPLAATK